jgi:cbb3-type cytochrome oxidase cytochrome c subunit
LDYFNDERYWNINLLNKWFAISSILFLISIVWMFIDDNDDAFKGYQKDFRKLEIANAEEQLEAALAEVQAERSIYEEKYKIQSLEFDSKAKDLEKLNSLDVRLKAEFYKANMKFLGQKAFVDEAKYLYEAEEVHMHETDEYKNKQLENLKVQSEKLQTLKLIKEEKETLMLSNQSEIKDLQLNLKSAEDELNLFLKQVNLTDKKLSQLDRQKMTFANKVGDFVRDLPIIDFLDPYYEVKQHVITDVKYDVNFANVSTVDRCTSCHLGISNPDFKDAEQPFTTHPDLDLYLTSSSPHPVEQYGCTSCHDGRSRGTTFNSSVHTPNSEIDKERWEEEYDWETMHHWIKPMMPTRYSQSACFNCHSNKPFLDGGEKINYGLALIKRNGCNNCHHIESYPKRKDAGPSLLKLNTKTTKEWTAKWIKDPKSFRHNTIMPSFFGQSNNSDPASVSRTDTEIAAITEYLFQDGEKFKNKNNRKYLGNKENGEILFNSLGCMGCHMLVESSDDVAEEKNRHDILNNQGPNLINLASKTSAEWVYKWIKNPKEYWPDTKMPDLRLSDAEAKDITSYLMSSSDYSFESNESPEIDSEELDKIAFGWLKKVYTEDLASTKLGEMDYDSRVEYVADKSIRYYGCYTCHEIKGYEGEKPIGAELTYVGSKPLNKFDFGHIHDIGHNNYSWFEQKLKDPRIFDRDKVLDYEDKSRMPNFNFSEEEIEAIVTVLLGFTSDNISENVIADKLPEDVLEGHHIINDLNCQGCHIIENFGGKISETISVPGHAPPNLNTQGSKTQPEWLYNFLKNPSVIRPPLQVRMPSFNLSDSDWNAVIKAFQSLEQNNLAFESIHGFDVKSDNYKAGASLEELGACNNCHFYGTTYPKQGAQTWAPNLAMTKDRLRYDWVVEWLRDPQKIMPGTLMPAPYLPTEDVLSTDDAEEIWGKSLVNLKGDHDAMLKGLADKIYNIKGKSDISKEVKAYFKENGYDFGGDEEDEDDEDW